MTSHTGKLTVKDHETIRAALKKILQWHASGDLDVEGFPSAMLQAIAALDIGNTSEFRYHFERPEDYFKKTAI